jgi:hypothetical protein
MFSACLTVALYRVARRDPVKSKRATHARSGATQEFQFSVKPRARNQAAFASKKPAT